MQPPPTTLETAERHIIEAGDIGNLQIALLDEFKIDGGQLHLLPFDAFFQHRRLPDILQAAGE